MALAHLISNVRAAGISFDEDDPIEALVGREVSELELLTLRRRTEEQRKARYHWSLLRDSIRNVRKAVEQADTRDISLVHGIHHDRKLNHTYNIQHAIFIPQRKEYLTSDGETVWKFHEDGRKKEMVTPDEPMDRIIFASQTNQYVGWLHKDDTLFLMNELFEIKSQSQTVGRIYIGTYNNNTGEMITVGPGFITCWAFRYGARHLIPRKTTTTEFFEDNMFSMMVLEETASRSQRIFFACGNGVVVYNVYEGRLLVHRKELHVRPITAITFFNPLKYLITGAMDGCIKVWDNVWCVKMVFVGHSQSVSSLAIYPHGPLFISASSDCTIRVWSMETCDEVDKTSIAEPVQGLFTTPRYDVFFTFAGKKVDLWRLNHLYHIHTNIGHRVNTIKLTTHPFFPVRAVLMCRDSSVRIVSPPTGEVLTTLIMPPYTGLIDAAYAIAENTMFTVSGNGDIIKCKTDVNPCKVLARWRCSSFKEVCNCLLVYEYVMDSGLESGLWQMMKRTVATKTVSSVTESRNRTLLLGGRKDGYICVYNWDTGNVDFKVEAHGSKGVLNMIANSKLDQLISAGMDNIVKVWRLYPFAEEALAPLMSFYCAHTPAYMSTIKSNLCVAFQDPTTATFNIVLYNLPEKKKQGDINDMFSPKNRHDHRPDDDHVDMITGLTSCSRMKLFASSSMDGTIRIWNDENKLVRALRLNAIPNSIGFCSSRGDLLVGIGLHLFHIPWYRYLPKAYLRKMVSMRFIEEKAEEPLPYDVERLTQMDKNDVKRLKGCHASFKVVHFEDELSKEEEDVVMHEKRVREKAFSEIEIRENELGLIRDGCKTATKKAKPTKKTQREAMKGYMKMFYDKERIQLPPDDPFPGDTLREKLEAGQGDQEEEYKAEIPPITFFQEVNRNRTPGSAGHGISPIGFVPNSVLVKILYPPPSPPPDPTTSRPYRPPQLTAKQLSEIRALKKSREHSPRRRSVTFADREESFDLSKRTLEFDLDEEDEQAIAEETEEEASAREVSELSQKEKTESELDLKTDASPSTPGADETDQKSTTPMVPAVTPIGFLPTPARPKRKKKTPIQEEDEEDEEEDSFWGGTPKSKEQSSLMNKFKDIMEKPPSPKPEEVEAAAAAEAPPPEEKPKPVVREIQQPTKPIRKLVSRPRQKVATPPPPKSPTPPPPPTPLPDFITQFVGTEWFEKYFPNCNETTMPKPWSGDNFVNMIMKLLRFASFPHKTAVAEAITLVHTQEILSEATCHATQKMLLTALNHHTHTPSCANPEQKTFILAAIKGLQAMGICDKEFVVEMLVQFLDGDREIRTVVLDTLNSIGLQDPHRQLQKELDSWDIWNIEETDRKKDLKKMCSQWLDRWMTSYKLHIKDAVQRLQKGQNLHGRVHRGSMAARGSITPSSRRGSMMPEGDSSFGGGGDINRPPTRSSVTLTIERPDMALAEHATYFEAMNYFCEMMTEKELEALRRGENLRRGAQEESVIQAKNTVLVLPKIAQKPALVRLGDTHTSKCRQSRETAFSVDFHQLTLLGKGRQLPPGQLTGFVPCINLPMKPVYLNPFPSPIDALDPRYAEPILITLKSSQKYFIPATSVVPQVAPSS